MPISEVKMADGRTLIDLTKDTVTAEKLLKGITAHDKAGRAITGTASGSKPEQEKEITISENGDYPITPDVGKVLSKILAHVNVSTGGGDGGDIEITTGTYVPAKDIGYREYVEIDTGNTKGKTVFVMWAPEYPGGNAVNFVACVYEENSKKKGTYGYADTSEIGRSALLSTPYAPGGKVKFAVRWSGAEVFKAGTNFKWVCVAGIPYN